MHFDTITITTLESSTTNYLMSTVFFLVIFCTFGSFTLFTHEFSGSQTTLLFDLATQSNISGAATGNVTTILNILAVCYLNSQLLEFYILNIFMFLAAYSYYKLRVSIRTLMITTSCFDIMSVTELFKKILTPIRDQSQSTQLDHDYAVRCLTLDNSSFESAEMLKELVK